MKRKNKEKEKYGFISVLNCVPIILCVISIGLLISTCLNIRFFNEQVSIKIKEINEILLSMEKDSEYTEEKILENIYMSYYNSIDQKATDSINTALSFFGFVFSLVTIINTVIAIRLPKQYEEKLAEIDKKMQQIEHSVEETKISTNYNSSIIFKKTKKEKIDAITELIDEYGDNSGEFYFARGFLYDDIKDYDNAKADYNRAKKAGGSEYTYHNSMGVLYSNIMLTCETLKDKKRALIKSEYHHKEALNLIKKEGEKGDFIHCNLACLYSDYAKAINGWSMIEKIKSRDASNEINIEEYVEEYNKYIKLALDELDVAISINEDFLIAFQNRGIIYEEMGEEYYEYAYEDYKRCYDIDPENLDILKLLAKMALILYQGTNENHYYDVARACVTKLRKDFNEIKMLEEKIEAKQLHDKKIVDVNVVLAQIDEKIGDLTLEEAMECVNDPSKYGNKITEAIKSYNSSLDLYKQLYSEGKDETYWNAIDRLKRKISDYENYEE